MTTQTTSITIQHIPWHPGDGPPIATAYDCETGQIECIDTLPNLAAWLDIMGFEFNYLFQRWTRRGN